MHLYRAICKILLCCLACGMPALTHAQTGQDVRELVLKWDFNPGSDYRYTVKQETRIQNFALKEDNKTMSGSPIHKETVTGYFALTALPDGNASGELVLALKHIEENGVFINVPMEQKIPQRVARFIMTPDGGMEDYSGAKKETYILSRLILGLPIHGLKQNQVRVYPFQLFTKADNTRLNIMGNVSHELNNIEKLNDDECARILTNIDLKDAPGSDSNITSIWKGLATSYFNIPRRRLEKMTVELAVKRQINPDNKLKLVQIIEIYQIDIDLTDLNK